VIELNLVYEQKVDYVYSLSIIPAINRPTRYRGDDIRPRLRTSNYSQKYILDSYGLSLGIKSL